MIAPYLSYLAALAFNRASEAIEEGRRSVERVLPTIAEYL